MSINEFIESKYYELKSKISRFNLRDKEDVFQETLMYFIELGDKAEQLIEENVADKYIMGMFKINAYSKTSKYRMKYKNKKIDFEKYIYITYLDDYETDVCIAYFDDILFSRDVFFADKYLFKHYVENKIEGKYSTKILSDETDIPIGTISKKITDVKNKLKNYD